MLENKKFKSFLPLELQYFADDGGQGDEPPKGDNPDDQNKDPDSNKQGDGDPDDGKQKKVEFSEDQQAQVNKLVAEAKRKAREAIQKELDDEKRRKELEDKGEYEKLVAEKDAEIERLKNERKQEKIDNVKADALRAANYSEDQIGKVIALVEGEEADDIKKSVDELLDIVPPKNAPNDPKSPGNHRRQEPPKDSDEDYGRSVFERVRGKKK